jgi:Ca2+-binding RTX toxin-like protein
MRRYVIATAMAVLVSGVAVGIAAPAYAAAENRVWVTGDGQLHYEYQTGAPATQLVIRSSGSVVTLDDLWGVFAGTGCSYPTEDGSRVTCVGVSSTRRVRIITGPNPDLIDYLPSGEFATMGSWIDTGAGNDTVLGGAGEDIVEGGDGDDLLNGWTGDDALSGGAGADRIVGGAGQDVTYYLHSGAGVTVTLDGVAGNDGAPGEGDTVGADVESVYGSPFADVLTGNASDNTLVGCGGGDRISGLDGNDILDGDGCGGPVGADVLIGGPGVDVVVYADRINPVMVDLSGSPGNDGEAGERDTVAADIENLMGGSGSDVLVGNGVANRIDAGSGNDRATGGDGDDTILGGQGDDTLDGGNGADTLDGDVGFDRCTVGPGGLTAVRCEA